jgi:mannosyltransferase OCH1-like enzyme
MSKILNGDPQLHLEQTSIPRMIHQTWKSTKLETYSEKSLEGIEKWLQHATSPETNMAYFMWNDDGVREHLGKTELPYTFAGGEILLVDILPKPVEVADIFRVVVCNTIGGVVRYPALDC